jgi:hypothetical protein
VDQPQVYIIKVKGILDPHWLDWFSGLQLTYEEQPDGSCLSVLAGEIKDQAELHGKLVKLRDLNLPLVELRTC